MEQAEAPAMEAPSAEATAEGMAEQAGTMVDEAAMAAAGVAEEAAAVAEEAAAAAEQAADETMAAAEQATEAAPAAPPADPGKQVYDMVCFACHAQGIAGAPKLGDKALWEPRIAKGMDTLVNNAINGFQGSAGVMPPKGGRMDLSDDDVKAAVQYMVDQVK